MNIDELEKMDLERSTREELHDLRLSLFEELHLQKWFGFSDLPLYKRLLKMHDRVCSTIGVYFPE